MVSKGAPDSGRTPDDDGLVAQALTRAVEQLRARKHRVTGARRAVIETLARDDGHPSAAELSAEIERRHPGIHLATVYRTLEFLTDLGIVTHVHMGHGTAAYHLSASTEKQEHLHARCNTCGKVLDLPADMLDPIRARLIDERDFILDPRHVALSGACRGCHDRDAWEAAAPSG